MITRKIAVIPGDGIGPEVIAEGIKVLKAAYETTGKKIEFTEFPFGAQHYLDNNQVGITDADLDELKKFDTIYFGAVGPSTPEAIAKFKELGGEADMITQTLLKLRFDLDMGINLRPIKSFPTIPVNARDPDQKIDIMTVRETTEELYAGISGVIENAQPGEEHVTTKPFKAKLPEYSTQLTVGIKRTHTPDTVGYVLGVMTKKGIQRAMDYAFDIAKKRNNHVTSMTKSNAMKGYALWDRTFNENAEQHPDVKTDQQYIDNGIMQLIMNPQQFDVVVCTNQHGDIFSDAGAGLVGSLGLLPSALINPEEGGMSMFEPVHGTAPDIAGQEKANPFAAIFTAQMMADHLGDADAANLIGKAAEQILAEGNIRTGDIGGTSKTHEVGDAVAKRIRHLA